MATAAVVCLSVYLSVCVGGDRLAEVTEVTAAESVWPLLLLLLLLLLSVCVSGGRLMDVTEVKAAETVCPLLLLLLLSVSLAAD